MFLFVIRQLLIIFEIVLILTDFVLTPKLLTLSAGLEVDTVYYR